MEENQKKTEEKKSALKVKVDNVETQMIKTTGDEEKLEVEKAADETLEKEEKVE